MYVLLCEPDEEGNERRYIGQTTNCERRICQHCGVDGGGAKWAEAYRPIGIISARVVETDEEAAVMETLLFNYTRPKSVISTSVGRS